MAGTTMASSILKHGVLNSNLGSTFFKFETVTQFTVRKVALMLLFCFKLVQPTLRLYAVWCLLNNYSLTCFVIVAESKQHLNCHTFPFLADTKVHVHNLSTAGEALLVFVTLSASK